MNTDPLNSFLDFNGDGEVDASEQFMGYMIFREIFKEEDEDSEEEETP